MASRSIQLSVKHPAGPLLLLASALLGGLGMLTSAWAEPTQTLPATEAPETYGQELELVFADAESATNAQVSIAPLYDDHFRAVSCRWDDNWTSDNVGTRDVMEQYGIKGTWYLNGLEFSPDVPRGDYTPVARKLLDGGNSIGGHSLTHPYLTYYHSNRMFAETAGVRVAWEAALDTPVCSYAYSFVDLRPQPEDLSVLRRSLSSLWRAGFYHVAENQHFFQDTDLAFELSPILPPENSPLDVFSTCVTWAYDNEEVSQKWPMISNSMHAWYDTERLEYGYEELRNRLKILTDLQDVWHCNQNEYAAYRRQFRFAKVADLQREGNRLTVTLEDRPSLVDLNDPTPLTLVVSNIEPSKLVEVRCEDASVSLSERDLSDKALVHMGHDEGQQLPAKIGHVDNPANSTDPCVVTRDPDFEEIEGALSVDGDKLALLLVNHSNHPMDDIRVKWRTPIGWDVSKRIERYPSLGEGETLSLSPTLRLSGEPEHRFGTSHFVAQVDFEQNGESGRIHFTCQQSGETPDDTWPLDHFALLGPIPSDQIDAVVVANEIESSGCPNEWALADGTTWSWRVGAKDGYVKQEWMNPEYIQTTASWHHISPTYLLRSKVHSPKDQPVEIVVSHPQLSQVLLNGQQVTSGQATLKAGENELIIIYPGATMSTETTRLAACYLRLADPTTGARLEDICYEAF